MSMPTGHARWAPVVLQAVSMAVTVACGPRHVRAPEAPNQTVVVLLPDPDGAAIGRAIVSNDAGAVELKAPRDSTRVPGHQPPSPPTIMPEREVRARFGDLLSRLPPAPRHFTLYFRLESDVLTTESRALLPGVLEAVKSRPAPEVYIVGHTDTLGKAESNVALGLKRARMVRTMLVHAGLSASAIEIASHGESDLLVQTPDETAEPRNRRVEITVR